MPCLILRSVSQNRRLLLDQMLRVHVVGRLGARGVPTKVVARVVGLSYTELIGLVVVLEGEA